MRILSELELNFPSNISYSSTNKQHLFYPYLLSPSSYSSIYLDLKCRFNFQKKSTFSFSSLFSHFQVFISLREKYIQIQLEDSLFE